MPDSNRSDPASPSMSSGPEMTPLPSTSRAWKRRSMSSLDCGRPSPASTALMRRSAACAVVLAPAEATIIQNLHGTKLVPAAFTTTAGSRAVQVGRSPSSAIDADALPLPNEPNRIRLRRRRSLSPSARSAWAAQTGGAKDESNRLVEKETSARRSARPLGRRRAADPSGSTRQGSSERNRSYAVMIR